jgi:hypothetical protein
MSPATSAQAIEAFVDEPVPEFPAPEELGVIFPPKHGMTCAHCRSNIEVAYLRRADGVAFFDGLLVQAVSFCPVHGLEYDGSR